MLDIIVLMNNNLELLIKTLGSISFQNYKNINVIIVNNTEVKLDRELELFNDLSISIISCKSSNLKNYGLNHSNASYVLFINSGDLLYNCFSISNLMVDCEKYDIITGKSAISFDGKVDFYDDLNRYFYGKLYSKEFINKNHLRFLNSKYFSDMAFNKMYLMCKPRIGLCNKEVYFTTNRFSDDNNKDSIIDYCKTFKKCIEESIDMDLDSKLISKTIYCNLSYLYNKYNINYDKDFVKYIFEYGMDIYKYYIEFNSFLSLSDKDKINLDYYLDIDYKCSIEEFIDMFTVNDK